MGTCNCTAKNSSDQLTHQIHEQDSKEGKEALKKSEAAQKKRAKNALIVHNQAQDALDNVTFSQNQQLDATDIVEIKKALKKHFIFSQLSEKQIDCFIKEMRVCRTAKNQFIFKQGDKSGSYYIILEGSCQIQINNEVKRTIGFGDSFGDLGIIYSAPRSASVYTLNDCLLVQIGRKVFKKVMDDINILYQKENKRFLEVLSFFKDLTEDQKNAIASTCLTETYQEGQVIFNKGDDANSFYVIREGIVTIKEKNHDLKEMECFGENSILSEGGTRANTLVSKTKSKLISMSRENVRSSLGDSIKNILQKNMVWKIIHQSSLFKTHPNLKWKEAEETTQSISFKKGEVVLKKNSEYTNCICVLLGVELKSQNFKYASNSIIELSQLQQKKSVFKIKEDMVASDDGCMVKVTLELDPPPAPVLKEADKNQGKDEGSLSAKQDKSTLQKKLQITDFHVVRKLREGNFGKVYACWNLKTQKLYAIKVLDRGYVEKAQIIQYIMNEEEILRTAPKHPFLVSFYKLIKDTNFIYFIMEFIEGEDLFDVITKTFSLNHDNTKFLVSQILLVMEHLHASRIIYRDLKPQNLMMNTNGYLTLVDLGTAKRLKIQRRYRTTTIIGTPHYMAPEIITGKGYSFPVDLWSLGVITYELLCGKLPFGQNSDDPFTIYEQIINSSVKYPRNCLKSCKIFIEKLLSRSPQHRMGNGFEQLKKHPFFDGIDWKQIINKSEESFYKASEDLKIKYPEIEKALTKEKNKVPNRFLADKTNR